MVETAIYEFSRIVAITKQNELCLSGIVWKGNYIFPPLELFSTECRGGTRSDLRWC